MPGVSVTEPETLTGLPASTELSAPPIRVEVEGVGVLEFPGTTPLENIKAYLDYHYAADRPRRRGSILSDLAEAFTTPAGRLVESIRKDPWIIPKILAGPGTIPYWLTAPREEVETAASTAASAIQLLGAPFEVPARLVERGLEQAPTLWGENPRSSIVSQVGGFATGLLSPWLAARALRVLRGVPRRGLGPPPAPPPQPPRLALPPAGTTGAPIGPPRAFQQVTVPSGKVEEIVGPWDAGGLTRIPLPPETGWAPVSRGAPLQRMRLVRPGPAPPEPLPRKAAQAPPPVSRLLGRPESVLERPATPLPESLRRAVGYLLSPVASRMEALGPEGFEAARLLRLVEHEARLATGSTVSPVSKLIQRLSPNQQALLFQHLHRGAPVTDPAIQSVIPAYQAVFGPEGAIPRLMQEAGLQLLKRGPGGQLVSVGPFRPRERFVPLEYPPSFTAQLRESAPFRRAMAEHLVRTGQAADLTEAGRIVRLFIEGRRLGRQRPSPGEFVREVEMPGYITDLPQAIHLRGLKTFRRLAEIKHLGPNDEKLKALVEQLRARDPEKAEDLSSLIDIALGGARGQLQTVIDRNLGNLARKMRTFQAFSKLPLAVIANSTQTIWTAFRTDFLTTTKAFLKFLLRNRETVEAARRLGAYVDLATHRIMLEYSGGLAEKATTKALIPQNLVERFNRIVAAQAGRDWADTLEAGLRALQGGPPSKLRRLGTPDRMYRELRRLGFSEDEARQALATGVLSPEQKARVAVQIVDQTQFIPSRLGRSEFFNSEVGMVFGQFRTFSMNLARMLNRTVLAELKAGNPVPALRLLVYAGFPMQIAGEITNDLAALIRRRQRPSLLAETGMRALENFMFIGALGTATDAVRSAVMDASGLIGYLGGVTAMDLSRLAWRVFQLAVAGYEGSGPELARQGVELGRLALRNVPYAGPALVEEVIPPTTPRTDRIPRATAEDLLGLSPRAESVARARQARRWGEAYRRWQRYRLGPRPSPPEEEE